MNDSYALAPGIEQALSTQEFYGITLEALVEAKNERLWFKTQLKLCSLWLKLREFTRATKLLKELHRRAPSSYQPLRLLTRESCSRDTWVFARHL